MGDWAFHQRSDWKPLGWCFTNDGVIHLLPGVTLDQLEGNGVTYTGRIVDSEGQLVREETPVEEPDD